MALGVFALGAPIGAWLGADLAGAVAHAYGWRAAFLALGIPGVVMGAIIYLTIREPARGRLDAVADAEAPPLLESLRFLWRQKAAFHVVMGSGVCALWGWGLIWFTPTFLIRSYGLNVGEAGAVTGHIHLVGGIIATAGTAWILSRPAMADPRRVVWLLAAGVGLTTIPSFIAYWTHSLWVAKSMFWLFIPAIYFYIGPVHGIDAESGSVPHARHVHRLVAGGRQCVQSDHRAAGRRIPERLVRRQRAVPTVTRCAWRCWCWRRPGSGPCTISAWRAGPSSPIKSAPSAM